MSFETEVKSSLTSINENLNKLLIWRAKLDERCTAHREQTDDVRETLYGNPNGVVKIVNSLLNCKKRASKWKEFWRGVLKTAVAIGIVSIVGWLLLVYKVIKIGG